MHGMHAATSKVENSAQGSSCKLKFVHGGMLRVRAYFMLVEKTFQLTTTLTIWNSRNFGMLNPTEKRMTGRR